MIKTHLSLVLVDSFFCNIITATEKKLKQTVTILILVDGFLQYCSSALLCPSALVTILILVDGFLQSDIGKFDTMMYNESQSLF